MDNQQLTPEAEKQLTCPHMNFACNVDVNRLEDSGRFMADITVKCADCDLPFHFKGLAPGLNLNGANVSVDGLEAHIALGPGPGGILGPPEPNTGSGVQGFGVTQSP